MTDSIWFQFDLELNGIEKSWNQLELEQNWIESNELIQALEAKKSIYIDI